MKQMGYVPDTAPAETAAEDFASAEDKAVCRLVQNLARVSAPADFDFRLRARLRRQESRAPRAGFWQESWRLWTGTAVSGLAAAGLVWGILLPAVRETPRGQATKYMLSAPAADSFLWEEVKLPVIAVAGPDKVPLPDKTARAGNKPAVLTARSSTAAIFVAPRRDARAPVEAVKTPRGAAATEFSVNPSRRVFSRSSSGKPTDSPTPLPVVPPATDEVKPPAPLPTPDMY